MGLRDKYNHAIQTAKGLRFEGSAQEQDGKLHFKGTASSEEDKNRIWDAIKTVADWQKDVVADIKVSATAKAAPAQPQFASAAQGGGKTYTVKPGDTLSKIAKEHLGDANAYREIFDANRDQLSDPDKIQPGQVLKIPTMAH